MGFRLAVSGGAENINLDEKTIESYVQFRFRNRFQRKGYRFWHCSKDYRKNVV